MSVHALDESRRVKRHLRPRRAFVVGGAAVLALCAVLVALAWRASDALMYGPPAHYAWSLADYPALARVAKPLIVHGRTGVTLVGRFFPGPSGATILLSHGYYGDQDEMLPVASMLHAAGFTVVTYNERGRDGSGGAGTWGALETQDLRSVVDPRVKAVVADASWPTLSGYMKSRLSDVILNPTAMYSPLALGLLELRTGADLEHVRPVDVIARISPRPILLIQGLRDTDVSPHSAVVNFDHARAPRQLWLVKGEGHEATVDPGGAGTSPRVGAFFARALR